MATRASYSAKASQYTSITIDRLFKAAFHSPAIVYDRESLLGWRPLRSKASDDQHLFPTAPLDTGATASTETPPGISIHETATRFVIEVELPSIKADSLYIEISGDLLIIRGEREMEQQSALNDAYRKKPGPMVHRYIQLPITARPGEVQARLEGNTVKVNIQKRSASH